MKGLTAIKLFIVFSFPLLEIPTLPANSSAITVFDPSNFAQNALTAIRDLQSNINEARMLANDVVSLANEAKNLTSLPFDVINEFSTQFSQLFLVVNSIDGMMEDLETLESKFDELYPDFTNEANAVSRKAITESVREWIQKSRDSIEGANKVQAQVMDSLPKTQSQLEELMSNSQGAIGILQATQAGNQIAGTISGNLLSLNTQLAALSQAHNSFLMEINSSAASARNRMDHVLDGWTDSRSERQIEENPY